MKQFLKQVIKFSFLVLVVAFNGCDDDDDTNFPEVEAGFTYTLNENSGTVTFINISSDARTYLWTFGDGSTSTEINPVKTYANGTYKVTLKATSVSGASGTFEDTITISIPNPIVLPVTFDDPNVAYNVASFNGASFEIVDNPDVSGTNDKASKVGAITNSGVAYEGINFDLGTQLDLTNDKTITMNFWSDSPVDVLLKLEQGTGPDIEVTSNHGGSGWELISFDFNSSNKYVRMTIFADGPGSKAGTFYFDDVTQIETPPKPCIAETTQSLDASDFNLTFQTDPGDQIGSFDATLTTVQNPDTENEVNTSCQVGQIDRNGGALFANNQIEFEEKFDFNASSGFKMKVWSPVAGTNVLVKLEDKTNSSINVEIGAKTTDASTWEELTFPFASRESAKYDKIIIFFELNTNTTQTYFIDDFMLYKSDDGGGDNCTAETAQSISAADLNMTFLTDLSPNFIEDGADFEWINNPDSDNSVNSSCKVGKITKLGNNPWDNNQFDLDGKLDFNTNDGLKIKVWSGRANTEVRIKLEEIGNPGNNTEQFLTTSVTSGWEELTFHFAAENSGRFNKIVIFFDLNANNTDTYYFDDLRLYGNGGGVTGCTPPAGDLVSDGGFESGTDACWSLFQNGGTVALDNSINNGGSWSGKITTNGPSNPAFKQERIGIGQVSAGDVVQIQFDHIGSVVQPGAVFNVLLFGEGASGASFTHVFNPGPTLSDSWSTFTGTFTIPAGTDVSSGISFLIEAVCGGDAGCSVSANIDNVSITLNP